MRPPWAQSSPIGCSFRSSLSLLIKAYPLLRRKSCVSNRHYSCMRLNSHAFRVSFGPPWKWIFYSRKVLVDRNRKLVPLLELHNMDTSAQCTWVAAKSSFFSSNAFSLRLGWTIFLHPSHMSLFKFWCKWVLINARKLSEFITKLVLQLSYLRCLIRARGDYREEKRNKLMAKNQIDQIYFPCVITYTICPNIRKRLRNYEMSKYLRKWQNKKLY